MLTHARHQRLVRRLRAESGTAQRREQPWQRLRHTLRAAAGLRAAPRHDTLSQRWPARTRGVPATIAVWIQPQITGLDQQLGPHQENQIITAEAATAAAQPGAAKSPPSCTRSGSGRASRLAGYHNAPECGRILCAAQDRTMQRMRQTPRSSGRSRQGSRQELLIAERQVALREAFAHLSPAARS